MARRLLALASALLAASPAAVASAATATPDSPAAQAPVRPRVVVLTVDGTSIEDWLDAGAFASLGAIGLLSTRTHASAVEPATLRASAYATLGAGTAAEARPTGDPRDAGDDVPAGALAETLARDGLLVATLGDASGEDAPDAPAGLAVMRADGTVATSPTTRGPARPPAGTVSRADPNAPTGRRTDLGALAAALRGTLEWASVVVVDLGDAARADRAFAGRSGLRRPWIRRALADADRFAGDALAMLSERDTLVVASLVPPLARAGRGRHLAAVAMTGRRGLPASGTTRRAGVITIPDLTPTILARAGVDVPAGLQGRTARIEPSATPRAAAAALDADLMRAADSRRPLTRAWLIAAAVLAVLALLAVASGRGSAPGRERVPRRVRDLLAVGLLAAAAAPSAMLIAPALPGSGVAAAGWWAAGLAVALALAARGAAGHERALAAIAILDAALIAADLAAGSPLAARSALGFQIAGGGRFYGLDEGLLGVTLAGALAGTGVLLDRARPSRRVLGVASVGLAVAVVVAGAPGLGSKFGAPFTLVPAFGVFLAVAAGRRVDRVALTGIAIATLLAAGAFAVADVLGAPEARTHVGREIAGDTAVGPLVARKLTGLVRITATTAWLPVSIAIAGSVLLLLARRRALVARAFWGMPGRRAALWGIAAGSACALVSNDTGIIAVAPALAIGAAAFYGPLLVPEDPPPRRPSSIDATLGMPGSHAGVAATPGGEQAGAREG